MECRDESFVELLESFRLIWLTPKEHMSPLHESILFDFPNEP